MDGNKNIIFFDGECHLCNGFVDFLINKDKGRHLYYAPLQGTTAQQYLAPEILKKDLSNTHSNDYLKTIMFHTKGEILQKSDAIFAIINILGGVYSPLLIFKIVPKFIRDFFYDLIANNRYKLFGQREFCRLAKPEERAYLLD